MKSNQMAITWSFVMAQTKISLTDGEMFMLRREMFLGTVVNKHIISWALLKVRGL